MAQDDVRLQRRPRHGYPGAEALRRHLGRPHRDDAARHVGHTPRGLAPPQVRAVGPGLDPERLPPGEQRDRGQALDAGLPHVPERAVPRRVDQRRGEAPEGEPHLRGRAPRDGRPRGAEVREPPVPQGHAGRDPRDVLPAAGRRRRRRRLQEPALHGDGLRGEDPLHAVGQREVLQGGAAGRLHGARHLQLRARLLHGGDRALRPQVFRPQSVGDPGHGPRPAPDDGDLLRGLR
mmetsp:Transcript_106072/g.300089  ORF Transcript_106072/g.300089 Transcript_106072/m.300089 type:complete len:234 (-) Transcript_106072:2486-3187(-)